VTAFNALGSRDEARAARLINGLTRLDKLRPSYNNRYLVKGLLDRGAFSCLYGPSNIGKSFYALDLAVRVSASAEFFGHRIASGAGPALYVVAEGSGGFALRVAALRKAHPDLVAKAERAGMTILTVPLDLVQSEDAADLAELILDQVDVIPSLIVIDTLARSMGGGDENAGKDMAALVANVGLLQSRLNAHVMLVHHTGKDQARGMRGHSSLHAALDSEIELSRPDPASKITTATARKQRDLEIGEAMHFALRRLEVGRDEDGDPVTSAVVVQTAAPEVSQGGAIAQNTERKKQAEDRVSAARRLLPTACEFSAADVAPVLTQAKLIGTGNPKSATEMTRRMLRKLAEAGEVVALEGGKFRVAEGAT
jgi:hypothetical protein